jgi:hypothetical protein
LAHPPVHYVPRLCVFRFNSVRPMRIRQNEEARPVWRCRVCDRGLV